MKYTKNQAWVLYLSLRTQYLSDRPMAECEQRKMWHCWHICGRKWLRIKDSELRENRKL
jgi:hypothetical protein